MVLKRGIFSIATSVLFLFISCPARQNLFAPTLLEYRIIYPDVARQMGLEGRVVLAVLINENGTVDQVRISKTSSIPILDSAATETARTFVFSPALMGDRPVKIWVKLPVEFKFEEVKPGEWLQEVKNLQKIIEKIIGKKRLWIYINYTRSSFFHPEKLLILV